VKFLEIEDVLEIQRIQLERFGGAAGTRDRGLLESALARPPNRAAYGTPHIAELAAVYVLAIARSHPFIDGNKRTAFLAADTFLRINGFEIDAPQDAIVTLMLGVAAGQVDEPELADWMRAHLTSC
jgi:death on curing protein